MLSLFVLGFAAPASADTLKDSFGETFEEGSEVRATSGDFGFIVGNNYTCEEARVETELTENGPEQITLVPFNTATVGCEYKSGLPVSINMTIGTIVLSGGEGNASFSSVEKYPPFGLICTYEGTLDFTYETGTDVLTVPESWVYSTGIPACPTMKRAHGNFDLTDYGTPAFFE